MPELPEVEALTRLLTGRLSGRRVERVQLASFAALKTFDPPLEALVGHALVTCRRRGKYLCFDFDGPWLVVHLARGGWVRWHDSVPTTRVKPGRGPLALRVAFEPAAELAPSPGIDITEMGTEKRLALWVVADPAEVEGVAGLGPDPLDPAFDAAALGRRLAEEGGTLKNALTRQSVVAGIGNAYSDEALHLAHLSPYKPADRLDEAEVGRLHAAIVRVLGDAVDRSTSLGAGELKGDKKQAMRVHGRTGEACPECGDVVREVSFASRSLQYCATCQTGGKPLADRRLSRLVK